MQMSFKCPSWVDQTKPPGWTPYPSDVYSTNAYLHGLKNPIWSFVDSPNFWWFVIACCTYLPYDIESHLSVSWFLWRVVFVGAVTFVYNGVWATLLYQLHWGARKFTTSTITFSNVLHNLWYSLLGVVQWVAWEFLFLRGCQSGKIAYLPDDQMFATFSQALVTIALVVAIPLWRDVHFYVAHRFIHFRILYKYVHSVHHRNFAVEPFSGTCMHPVEHLYYFTSIAPSLFLPSMSPFLFWWIGVHLLISPGAAHSGYEDHYASDQFHATHHLFFDCNFGGIGVPFDKYFKTYRPSNNPASRSLAEGVPNHDAPKADKRLEREAHATRNQRNSNAYLGLPNVQDLLYMCSVLFCGVIYTWFYTTVNVSTPVLHKHVASGFVSVGPIVTAGMIGVLSNDKFPWRWPFHKMPLTDSIAHVATAIVLCIVPVHVLFLNGLPY